MRLFLHYLDSSFITIKKEIEIIKLYIEIEQIRLNDHFSFEFIINESILLKEIPTNLIQPFLENAIKHGISHSLNSGKLVLKITQENEFIKVIIEDNGIGRKASIEINKSRKNHISKGIKIVEEKIKNLEEKYEIYVTLKLIDLGGELEVVSKKANLIENNLNGTVVLLKIFNLKNELYNN